MSRDIFTIDGKQYVPTDEQRRLIDEARAEREAAFAEIEAHSDELFHGFSNAGDPYRPVIHKWLNRVREIFGAYREDGQ